MRQCWSLGTAALVLATVLSSVSAGGLTPEEQRGREIFRHGISKSGGEITATLGTERIEIPANTLLEFRLAQPASL